VNWSEWLRSTRAKIFLKGPRPRAGLHVATKGFVKRGAAGNAVIR